MSQSQDLYVQYCELRRACGYDDFGAISRPVWDACDRESQQNMVAQMRKGAKEVQDALLRQTQYNQRYGVAW